MTINIYSLEKRQIQDLVAYLVPVALLLLGCTTSKLIEGKPWRPKHFFVGLDLTIYLLATCLVNVQDLTKATPAPKNGYSWTVSLIAFAILCLFFQMTVHQDWEDENKRGWKQTFMLCGVSNAIGLMLLYGFMRLKMGGLL